MGQDERRKNPRLPADRKLMVSVVTAPGEDALEGASMHCPAVDISADGVRLLLDTLLPAGAEVELWLKAVSRPEPLLLNGVVRWGREAPQTGHYWVGVELSGSTDAERQAWEGLFS